LLDAYAKAYAAGAQAQQPQVALPDPELTSLTPRDAMLWATAVNPAGGTLQIVEADAKAALAGIDWNAELAARADRAIQRTRANQWLRPLVPRRLARFLR
jgi:hypothetical protein